MHVRAIATIIIVPALIYGCSPHGAPGGSLEAEDYAETSVAISSGGSEDGITDIFLFRNDRLRRLDAYQRVTGQSAKVASTRGERILVAVRNPHCGTQRWAGVNSYESLLGQTTLLTEDSPDAPTMAGEIIVQAGEDGVNGLNVERMMSEIHINSLQVDFSGTKYDGEPLADARIYLTNVNAECRILQSSGFSPGMVVNFAGFDEIAARRFSHAEMLGRELGDIGRSKTVGPFSLYCYPCDHAEETAGSPFTRLVVEGSIRGHLYYYPITVNRQPFGEGGVERGRRYNYDIVIRRCGTADPDIPADTGMVAVTFSITPWTEMENTTIKF